MQRLLPLVSQRPFFICRHVADSLRVRDSIMLPTTSGTSERARWQLLRCLQVAAASPAVDDEERVQLLLLHDLGWTRGRVVRDRELRAPSVK